MRATQPAPSCLSKRQAKISIYIPGTKPHCLVSTEGNVNFLGTRNLVSVSKTNHPKLRSLSGHASIIASEARKAVGLSRSLAIPQLRVSVYDVTIRNTYRDPESCHRPTCGTTISLNVRTTSFLEDFFRR